jgi:ATP-binding cassette, subfamily C (CFTR/MRP), member 1
VSPILAFAVFSILAAKSGDSTLDTATVFTSLSLFTLLAEPLSSLIMALSALMGGVGSFKRIQEFISMEAMSDRRKLPSIYSSVASSVIIDSDSEKNSVVSHKDRSSLELSEMNTASCQAVVIENGLFGWDKDKPSGTLQGINMIVPRGKITMVVGPVGCGKSTLLKAVLGELPVMGGTLQLSSLRIALCDQTAWHVNGTVQQSITGSSAYDLRWYSSVVRSCALDEDLRQLPQGDQTQIGSKGIALSGGQSQRIVRHPVHPTLPPASLTHHLYRRLQEPYTRRKTLSSSMTVSVGLTARRRTRYGTASLVAMVFSSDAGPRC